MKILVLDDHDGFRNEIVDILIRNGHATDGVASAIEAVALVEDGDYDLVLVDYNMPDHDGLWFMKNAKRPRSTKALLVTAHVDRGIIDEMFRSGAAGYIIKPFGEDDLLHHIGFHYRKVVVMPYGPAGRHTPPARPGSGSQKPGSCARTPCRPPSEWPVRDSRQNDWIAPAP